MADVLDRLRHAPFEIVGRFADASNATLLVQFTDDEPTPLTAPIEPLSLPADELAVYKPMQGEAPLWDFPDGTLHRREVAAYVMSELLGWEAVPATVLRDDGPYGPGSLQRYVPHDPERHYFVLLEEGRPEVIAQLERMVVFDLVIDNADRKGGHVLAEPHDAGERLWLVDHGVSFNADRKLRTVAWDFAGRPVPESLVADVQSLTGREHEVRAALDDLLSGLEIDVLLERLHDLVHLDEFPAPIGPRPFPWPLV